MLLGSGIRRYRSRSSKDRSSDTLSIGEDLNMADTAFATPDLTTFARLDGLGLRVSGQFLEPARAVLACRVVGSDAAPACR